MHRKYPGIYVAVDKDRCHGIEKLTDENVVNGTDVILLDDAFQHRYVNPSINILLVDYHRLIIYDKLLPAGRLREHQTGKSRANIVIITKCPSDLKPMEIRVLIKALDLFPYQTLFFTTLEYKELNPIFEGKNRKLDDMKNLNVLLLTGIASPQQMILDIKPYCGNITPLSFSDHHAFTTKDVEIINNTFASLPSPKAIITTEKDESRILDVNGLSEEVKSNIYTLPVEIKFMQDEGKMFNENIIGYVRKNSRNSILAKRKDDNKTTNSNNSGDRTRTISFRNN